MIGVLNEVGSTTSSLDGAKRYIRDIEQWTLKIYLKYIKRIKC